MDDLVKAVPGWDTPLFGFNQGTLAILLGLIALVFVTRQIAMLLLPRLFGKIAEHSEIAGQAILGSSKALGTAMGAAILWRATLALEAGDADVMPDLVAVWLPAIAHVVMLIAIIVWALRLTGIVQSLVEKFDDDEELDGTERTLIGAVESVLRFCIVVFGTIFVADALNFDLTSMVAGLGITGLALALAAKDSISNIFGAITVLLDRPFRVGDWILVSGVEGEVVTISLRTTLVRTSLDTIITLPNASLTNKSIENFGKRRWRRYTPILSVDLDSDPDALAAFCKDVEESIGAHPKTMKEDASYAKVASIAKDSIEIGCNIYWDVGGGMEEREARQAWLLDVTRLAKKHGIAFFEPRVRRS